MQHSALFFTDVFGIESKLLEDYGAFDISLICDLPLFIDPFLIFHSAKPEYQRLHAGMIEYLRFLRDRNIGREPTTAELQLWYCFPEVRQNWLGFSRIGNRGSGLGLKFARTLHASLGDILTDIGSETITTGNHIEKVALIRDGVGRDTVSDFATNLILGYLCEYTARFAAEYISKDRLRPVAIARATFNYDTETWQRQSYLLPIHNGEHVILTPRDLLTRDATWINRRDMLNRIMELPDALPDDQLRAAVSNYFWKRLADLKPVGRTSLARIHLQAAAETIRKHPELIDCYIKLKEDAGDEAHRESADKMTSAAELYSRQMHEFLLPVLRKPGPMPHGTSVHNETLARLRYLKHVIENRGGWRIFYLKGKAIEREEDIQVLFKLVWFATAADVSSEVNDGRGPADFKISRGREKTIVEFKLAGNRKLAVNLSNQAVIYQSASEAQTAINVIVYYTAQQCIRMNAVLDSLPANAKITTVIIDARRDNKLSGSRAFSH